MTRSSMLICLAVVTAVPLIAQTGGEQVSAQGFGPVALGSGDRLDVCLANMGEATSRSAVRVFEVTDDAIRPVDKHDAELTLGKGTCYKFTPRRPSQLFVVLAGDPKSGWDVSDRNLAASAQVVENISGKARVVLTPVPKVVSTKLLQQ